MEKTVSLTENQAAALEEFCNAVDLVTNGTWPAIEEHMQNAGFDDPEGELEAAREVLRGW